MTKTYPSKVDTWLKVVLALSLIVDGAATIIISQVGGPLELLVVFLFQAPLAAFLLWIFFGTFYRIDRNDLLIRCGPFRWTIPISEIHAISSTSNPLSSPALSLDRLQLEYGSPKRTIMVSPVLKEEFLGEIQKRMIDRRFA